MEAKNDMIAVCGLDCGKCEILEASTNGELAKKISDWFKKERNTDVKVEDIYCQGCKGDKNKHWSPDCWILQCCVDEKGLEFCSECEDFVCEKLTEWAKGNERYENALNRLKQMRKQ